MRHYANDPRLIKAKFRSKCETCGRELKKGDELYYWPSSRKVYCPKCGENDYNQFLSSAIDEELYMNQY